LGLEGKKIKDNVFESVLDGHVPGRGITLGRTRDEVREHRAGVDLTFSAPKSVSLAALALDDERVIKAHETAVKRSLEYIEENLLETRIYSPEQRKMVRTLSRSMVAATFQHEASREQDPQLHTHCVIANMTLRQEDGKWMSIETPSLTRNTKFMGAYYRNELARELLDIGYELVGRDIGGVPGFEIKGFEKETLVKFSTRRQQILDYLKEHNLSYNSRNTQTASYETRPRKVEISQDEFRQKCRDEAKEWGLESPLGNTKTKSKSQVADREEPLRESHIQKSIMDAVDHLECRTPVFSLTNVKTQILGHLAGQVSIDQIEAGIAQLEADGHIRKATRRQTYQPYVSAATLRTEEAVVDYMKDGIGKREPLRSRVGAKTLAPYELTRDQANAVTTILKCPDKVMGVQGAAGTGKTTMLRALKDLAPEGHNIIALGPSTSATFELSAEAQIPSKTLQYFLTRYSDLGTQDEPDLATERAKFENTTLILDEASMVSTVQMKGLFDITEKLEIDRVVLVGDKKQLRAIEAGQPFRIMQTQGMETPQMNEIIRQKDQALKEVVEATMEGNLTKAIEDLVNPEIEHGRLVEVEHGELAKEAGRVYMTLTPEERENTLIITQTNQQRRDAHEVIREGLNIEGVLTGEEFSNERLIPRHMSNDEKKTAFNYEDGNVCVFRETLKNYRIEAGDHCIVSSVSQDGKVHLDHPDGKPRHIEPADGRIRYRYDVYEPMPMELRAGDLVRVTRNDKDLDIKNGDRATIESIDDRQVKMRMTDDDDDRIIELPRGHNAMKHIDHGYAITTYGSQSKTADRVIAVLDSGIGSLVDQSNLYVDTSRGKYDFLGLTDNIKDFTEALEVNTGEKMTAMEAVGKIGHVHDIEEENGHDIFTDGDNFISPEMDELLGLQPQDVVKTPEVEITPPEIAEAEISEDTSETPQADLSDDRDENVYSPPGADVNLENEPQDTPELKENVSTHTPTSPITRVEHEEKTEDKPVAEYDEPEVTDDQESPEITDDSGKVEKDKDKDKEKEKEKEKDKAIEEPSKDDGPDFGGGR
jgi:conjugative relaxase-like TrwC/TraI family protein